MSKMAERYVQVDKTREMLPFTSEHSRPDLDVLGSQAMYKFRVLIRDKKEIHYRRIISERF
jgi:hypothetical protein